MINRIVFTIVHNCFFFDYKIFLDNYKKKEKETINSLGKIPNK